MSAVANVHPENLLVMVEQVKRFRDDLAVWRQTGRGPDDTRFPPRWPLTYAETAELIVVLAGDTGDA